MVVYSPNCNPDPRKPATVLEALIEAQKSSASLAYALEHIKKLQLQSADRKVGAR
jgi:hypothetical protein